MLTQYRVKEEPYGTQIAQERTLGKRVIDTLNTYDLFVRPLDLPPGSRILDVTAGTGGLLHRMGWLGGFQMHGISLDEQQPEAGREVYGDSDMVQADPQAIPFARGSFDAVISRRLLEHIPPEQLKKLLLDFKRVGKSGRMIHQITVQEDMIEMGIETGNPNLRPASWWIKLFSDNRLRVTSNPNKHFLDRRGFLPVIREMHGYFVLELL